MSFSEIPDSYLRPGVFVEVDPTVAQQGPGVYPFRALVVGERTSAGTAAALEVKRTTRISQAREQHGPGSLTHLLAEAWLRANPVVELDVVSVASTGVAATQTVTFTGTPTSPAVLAVYIAGKRLQVLCQTSATVCGDALEAAVTADPDLPVTASNAAGVVTITAKNTGSLGNSIDIRVNHLVGEETPDGITVAVAAGTAGTGEGDLSSVFAAIAGTHYDVIVHPYIDATNLDALQAELAARADALVGQQGHGFSATTDSHANLQTLGDSRNEKWETIIGLETFPGWGPVRGAAIAGQAARYLQEDPARPLTGRAPLRGYAPADADKFTANERNLLLLDGISTVRYDSSDTPEIERLVTTYKETGGGTPDPAFRDVQTMFSTAFTRRSWVAHFAASFPAHKVADNGTPAPPGSAIVTPDMGKADAVAWYQGLIQQGIAEDLDGFVANTRVQRHATDQNRLEFFLAVNYVDPLYVTATLLQIQE